MSEKKDGHRARSRSSSLSSSDEEYKNLTKEERREKKLQKKNQRRKDRSSSSSSSCSSSSDEEYKNLPKDEKIKRKKEKKDMRRKRRGGKKKGSLALGKEHKHHHPIAAAHAKKADVNVPSAEEEKGVKAYAENDGQKDTHVDAEKDGQTDKHDDADNDTANKNATADDVNANLNNRTDYQSLDKDAEDEKHEETQKEEITVDKGNEQTENKTLLKTKEETDNQNTEQSKTYQSNTDNDLFVMKSDDVTNTQDKNEEKIISDDVKNTQDKNKEKNRSDDVTKTQDKNEGTIRSDDVTNTQVKNQGNDVSNTKNTDTNVSDRKDATYNDTFDVENKGTTSSAKVDDSDYSDLKHDSELTKDGETKSTERRNSDDDDDSNKKLTKSDSDEKDSLNDKTVTYKPENNDTGETVEQKPSEKDEGPSQSTSFDDPPSIVDNTVENQKRIDEKHIEQDEGSSQSTSFDDPPPIQTEVPSPTEQDTKMAQSSESTDAHSRNKQENVLKWEIPSDDEHEVGSRNKNVAEEDKNTETRKDISDKHGVDHEDEKDNDDIKSDTKSEDSIKIYEDHENVSDDENEEGRMKEKDDENQKPSERSEDTKHVVIAPEVKITPTKEKQKASTSNKGRQSKSPQLQYKQNRESPRQQNNRRTPEDRKFRRPIHSAPVTSKSGGMNRPKTSDGRRCISRGVKKPTKKKKQEESAEEASAAAKQKKEYKIEELKRLQEILKKEKSHIRKPKQRAHFPFVWTSLEPYYNTHTAAFLIDLQEQDEEDPKTPEPIMSPREQQRPILFHGEERPETVSRSRTIHTPEEFRHNYISRSTAQGLCDPWVDLRMDNDFLPKIGSAQRTSTRGTHSLERTKEQKKEKEAKEKKREQQGSTRLPKFPVVPFHTGKENATMRFPYQDIPKFRQEIDQRFSLHAPQKVDSDYKRTKEDFYRMELDKLDDVHPLNRPHMRKAYFAYLQNTPGSKKAITECVKSLDGPPQQQRSGSAQRVS